MDISNFPPALSIYKSKSQKVIKGYNLPIRIQDFLSKPKNTIPSNKI